MWEVRFIDYYAFEYAVLMRLNDIFSIESIEVCREDEEVTKTIRNEFGKLYNAIVSKMVVRDSIRLNLSNDFHVEFSRDSLRKPYEENCEIEDVVRRLRKYVETQWLKRIHRNI